MRLRRLARGQVGLDDGRDWNCVRGDGWRFARHCQHSRSFGGLLEWVRRSPQSGGFDSCGNQFRETLRLPSVIRAEIVARRKVEEIIEFLRLQPYRDARVGGLPYGVRKMVELGRALACEPKLLLLDEPSSGLNVEETDDIGVWISDIRDVLGITVLMVEHDMRLISAVSDRVMAVHFGKQLAIGSAKEVQRDPAVISAYLGT